MKRTCAILVAWAVTVTWTRAARAHDETVSASDVDIDGARVTWKVDVGILGLSKAVRLPRGVNEVDEADLKAVTGDIARYLQQGLSLTVDGRPLTAVVAPDALEPRYEPSVTTGQPALARVSLTLRYEAPAPITTVTARLAFFSELTQQHRAVAKVRFGSESRQFTRLGPSDLVLERGRLNPTRWTVGWDFLRWGTHHIFIGYDHIAFLLALLLAVRRLRELVKIVTSFTVAHSITLLLSALDVIRVPSQLTEALIAASIVYVAVENLLQRGDSPHRWLLTFGFGLVHGLGFAGVLSERLAEAPGGVVWPVLSFNVGVELGQLVIVAVAFPLLMGLRRTETAGAEAGRQQRIVRLGSIPILVLGVLWLGERLLP